MRILIIFKILIFLACTNLSAQLRHKNILTLKLNPKIYQDSSSLYYLEKYKNIPNLLVQIRDNFEHQDLDVFKNSPDVKRISISSNSVNSLTGLEHLKNLESLSINSNKIEDFSPLKKLKAIKKLRINSKNEFNFSLKYPLLEELKYSCNFDLQNCSFPKLEYLAIHQADEIDHDYKDVDVYGIEYKLKKPSFKIDLSHFENLNTISIYDMEIQDISEINFPKNLKHLRINNCNQITNVDQIGNLNSLESLTISHANRIESFHFLSKLKNVKWIINYMGKRYKNEDLDKLLQHPKNKYFYADDNTEYADSNFYNFHTDVIIQSRLIFSKYHNLILSNNYSRKQFLDIIVPLIGELNALCNKDNCNIDWSDEESYYVINFLTDMAQIAGYKFKDSHFYLRFEWAFE